MPRVCFTLQVRPERVEEYRGRWQAEMAELFDLGPGTGADTTMRPLDEVFHLE